MAEVPRPSSSADQGYDMDGLIRLSMSPPPAHRPKRSVSGISVGSSSTASEALPSAEELLTQTLLAIEGDEVSYDVFQFAIEMLEDISKHYSPGQSCKDIFGVIFALLLKAVPPIQARAVATMNQLITSNPGIIQFTKDTEWLSELLSFLPRFEDASVLDELFKMIEILGSYHISVKQVKMMFKLFQVEDTVFKSYYWQNIFPLLQRLWHGRDGRPNDYFELDGYNSGLLLPALKLPGGGYSIATWVCVSSFSSNYQREAYQPYLFSFLTEDGTSGIEAHFNRGKLILRTNPQHSNTSKRELRIVNYEFSENRWYFIALTHTKKLILSDECNVYVNGESIQHFNLKYPKPEQALKASRLGTAGLNPEPKSCLRGQLAGFLAFDDTLNADEVRALYHHGPNLFSSLKPLEQLVLMPRSRLARRPNVLFFYSPRATDYSVCLEPWSNDTTRRANMLAGVRTCITTGFQDSLSSVGGIQLLLPLFSSKYRPSSTENVDVNTKVLSLLIELVTDNEEALTEMWRSRFFQIMGYLLATDYTPTTPCTPQSQATQGHPASSALSASASQVAGLQDVGVGSHQMHPGTPQPDLNIVSSSDRDATASHTPGSSQGTAGTTTATKGKPSSNKWSPQSIEVLDKLAFAVSRFGATGGRSRGPLFEQFFRHVYLNFHIWTNADYEVQLSLLKSINTHVKSDPELFHGYFSVVQLMTVLNEHFTLPSNTASNDRSDKTFSGAAGGSSLMLTPRSGLAHTVSGNVNGIASHPALCDWSKRPRAHLIEVRKALLGTLHCFVQVGISLKEAKAIISYLHHEVSSKSEDRRLITDVLQVLLISIGERHASLLHHLNAMGNLVVFLPLLKSETEKFRVWTLKVIGKLLQNADSEPGHKESIIAHLPSLRKVLEPYPLSIHTYNVLLEILIDNVSADGLINPVDFALHPSTPSGSASTNLKNLKMISVIFQLLNARSTTELRIKVLKDFLFYLKRGPENRSKFTAQHDWQAWLLTLLVPDQPPASISATGGSMNHSSSSGTIPGSSHAASTTSSLIPVRRHRPIPALKQSNNSTLNNAASSAPPTPTPLNVSEAAAHNVLLGLVTEIFSLLFETALLQGSGGSANFEVTSDALRRMASIKGFDAISIANTINTKVLKMMAENNIVAKCKVSPATFQICVQYLTFVESTFFRVPPASSYSTPNPQTPASTPAAQTLSGSSASVSDVLPGASAPLNGGSSPASSRSSSTERGTLTGSAESSSNDSSATNAISPSPSLTGLSVSTSGLFGTGVSTPGPNTPTGVASQVFGLIQPHGVSGLRASGPVVSMHHAPSRLSVGSASSSGSSNIGVQNGNSGSGLVGSASLGAIHSAGSTAPTSLSSAGVTGVPLFGEKDSIRFGDRVLLPLWLHYGSNGSWLSFTLAQRILDLVDQLVLNKVERSPTMEIAPELLDRLEAALSRFRTRLVLYSIAEGATFKSTTRLRLRKESIRNIRQIVHEGFSGASSKAQSAFGDLPTGGVQASLARYLGKKAKQWDTEMSDVDSMFHKNIKRVRALLESTPSTHAALFLLAYIGALVQKANASPQNALASSTTSNSELALSTLSPASSASSLPSNMATPSASAPTSVSTPAPTLINTASSASSAAIINSIFAPVASSKPEPQTSSSSQTSIASIFSPPSSPMVSQNRTPAADSQSVQHTDESVQLTQQLWRDAIQNIRQRLSGDANYGPMFSKLEGEVLWSFFDSGLSSPKDFVLSPAIEKAIDYIVANDVNALTSQQNAMRTVSERYTDLTQNETMQELEMHKSYEMEWTAMLSANTIATAESSSRYAIRYSQYISIIASEWKNLLRVLLDTRGPWSSPYSSYRDELQSELREPASSFQIQVAYKPTEKMYWKLDSTENSQRMRLKMKRHYGDTSILEFASAKNDEKERLMIESLSSSSSSTPMSPNASMSSLPAFEFGSSIPSSPMNSGQVSNNLSRADLLKLVARRGNATALDEDDAGMIDPEYGVGDGASGEEVSGSSATSVSSSATASSSASQTSQTSSTVQSASSSSSKVVEERTLILTTCEYVKGISSTPGDFEVTTTHVYFRNLERGVFKIIPLEKLRVIYSRRYMLQNTALELFTTDRTSHFFHFDKESPAKILKVIVDRRPVNLREYFAGSSHALARKKKHITEAWKRRQISNFEYLMELNTIAGRSYNDLSQYPVFPWIIADYESEKIDLNNPAIYRDLSKPIGALDPSRLEKFLVRWDEMVKNADEQMNSTPPFLYGSHYSSHSIVLYYLIRLEPFTTQSLELQGGQFDLPARLFTSIPESWRNCLINQSDVKELIPEFFYLPAFLNDTNDINLGCLKPKDGSTTPISIDTVELPPWAPSAQAFVQMNRLALESEYVSAHLHEWIDLIFGYKQLGQEAVDAHNVFYYTSYEGNIDIDSISDPMLKQSVQMQIREFGQTPSQLFSTPHPVRLSLEESQKAKRNALATLVVNALSAGAGEAETWKPTTADLAKTVVLSFRPNTVANAEIVSIHVDTKNERFVLIFMDGLVQTVAWKIPRGKRFPLQMTPQWAESDIINNVQKKEEHSLENTASAPGLNPSQACFVYLDNQSKVLINAGSWDRSITISMVTSTLATLQSVSEHKDIVTCLAVTQDFEFLISASRDCNVLVWDIASSFALKKKVDAKDAIAPKPKFVLFGHDDAINCVAVNANLNVIVTASQDCTSIVYDLRKGRYIRTIVHDSPVTLVAVSNFGDIVTYCASGEILSLHTVNGTLLKRINGVGKLSTLKFSTDGQLLVTSGQNIITVRSLFQYSLKRIYLWKCPTAISSIELFNQDEYLLIGLCDGSLLTVIFDMNKVLTDMSREMAMEKQD
jgi:WD40 repeat protein